MSLLDKIWDFFEDVGEAILAVVSSFASAGVRAVADQGGVFLVNSALAAVEAAENTGGSGMSKLDAALDQVKSDVSRKGLAVGESVMRFAIESAVQQLKVELKQLADEHAGGAE